MNKIIISCDDLGVSEETNLGIKECLIQKVATSSSIIANGNAYDHALNHVVKKDVIKFFGIHLNITEGKALNSKSINNISNNEGEFKFSAKKYFLLNFGNSKNNLKNLVYEEFKSQIFKVLNDGIKISHFDSHEHIHHSPWIFKIVETLGKEFNIRKIRFVNEKIVFKNYFKNINYKIKSLNYFKHMLINLSNLRIKNTFISPDYFFGLLNSGELNMEEFFTYLDSIGDDKIIELCIHPANKFKYSNKTSKKNHLKFYKSENREKERNILLSYVFKKTLLQKKINLINFSNI